MLKLLKIIKKTGDVTIKYPFGPAELTPTFKGKPEYDPKQCIACGACALACPANALTMETNLKEGTRTLQLFVGRCIYCGRCEEVCPARAIELKQNFELAVFNKADLYETGTFKLCNCQECGLPFAPAKEVEHALSLTLQASGISETPELRKQFETCHKCKRTQSVADLEIAFGLIPNRNDKNNGVGK